MRSIRQGSHMENVAITSNRQDFGRTVRRIGISFLDRQACRIPPTGPPWRSASIARFRPPIERVSWLEALAGRTIHAPIIGLRISSPHHRPISSQRRRAVRCSRSALAAGYDDQAVATPCPVDPGPAIDVTRTKAVMPTAIAPITEKTSCQVSDGMVCFTMPCVA